MTRTSASAQVRFESLSTDQIELVKLLLEKESREARRIRRFPRTADAGNSLLPTSWAQERLWFIDRLEGGSSAYHISHAVRLRGVLDRQALQNALNALVRRHEILRTVFECIEGLPQQRVIPDSRFNLSSTDLRAASAHELQVEKAEELHTRFDLQTGPLIRGKLLWLQDGEYVLIITMHHIVSDGWSMGVLVRELSELYSAEVRGTPAALGELPIQYSDYAQWQREWLRGEVLDEQLNYWRDQLQGANPQLELPTDRPRPQVQSYRGANLPVALDTQLTAKVMAFAQRHDLTLFMTLLSAWSILLSRLSGQDDVVIGTPIANRQRSELEGMIGFFVNTLALRVPVASNLTVAAFIESVKSLTLRAYSYQDIPFEKIVEALQPQRSLSRNPIFQAMLAVQNSPAGQLALPGLEVNLEEGIDEPSLFDILLSLEVRNGRLVGVINYPTDLFDRATVQSWFDCFKVLLRGLIESDETQIGDLSILTELELRRLQSFNATQVDRNQNELVHELFEERVRQTPDVVAVMHDGASLTYRELNRRANQLARHLLNEGVSPDQPVGVCVERSLEMVIALLAVLKSGGAYLPLDPNYPPERLRDMLSDAGPRVILTQEELLATLPSAEAQVIVLRPTLNEIADHVAENISAAEIGLNAENLVYVIYTSGSTGRPKGTAMPHGSMTNLLDWHQSTLTLRTGERVLQFAALSFDVAFQEIFSTLCGGGSLMLLDEWVRKDARALAQLLSRNAIERLFVPPLVLQSLAECYQSAALGPLSLKDVITAGEQLRVTPEIVDFFGHLPGCRLHNHYGPTETHVVTALTLTGDTHEWPALPWIGRPVSNTQIHILDPRGQAVPTGVVGEIFIGGANVARGYLDRPELTRQRFLVLSSGRCYRTGDLGRWRADGTVEYLGRNDDQVKIRGFRIELGEIEAHLSKHAQVKEAAVIAREDAPGQKRLVAYVVPRDTGAPGVEDLRGHCKATLPEHLVPSAFVILEKLPLNPNGKLDRRALPAPELEAYVSRQFEEPAGEIEQTLAKIWRELLRVPRVGRNDNFFELGGHSLLMVQMMERLRRAGLSVEVRDVYVSSTLVDLARTLAGVKKQSYLIPPNRIPVGCEKITPEMLPLVDLEPQHIERIVHQVPGGAPNIQDIYPLAPLQEGILFHHLLNEHGGDTYVLPMLLSLPSRAKLQELIRGLEDVIARHDILRTAVMWKELPRPLQVVSRQAALPVEELALDPSRDPIEQLKERMTPELQRLNLQQAPMMKLNVAYEPRGAECYALLQLHHLTCDHESLEVMLAEVAAYMSGNEKQLPQPTPYRNHVAQAVEHARQHDAQAFFRGKLADVDEPTAAFGLLDVHGGGTRIEEVYQTLDPELSRRLREQARLLSVSAATLFHAAWALVVARTSGRDDVVFGSVLLGRLQGTAGAQQTLGMFINTLPMRLRLEKLTAKQLVRNTQTELVELLNHEQASLAQAQRCANVGGSTPLFNSLLNYRHSSVKLESGVAAASDVKLIASQGWTNFPIMLSVDVRGDDFVLEVATDRRVDPRQLLGHMETSLRSLVQALSRASDDPVLGLPILAEAERGQLTSFNATQVERNDSGLVHQLFEEQARRTPDVVAVTHDGESLTYWDLNRRANQMARHLLNEGVGPDQLVAVCVNRSLEMVVGLLAILKAGGAYLPLDPNYPPERLRHMLDDAAPKVVLTQAQLLPTLPATQSQIIVLKSTLEEIADHVAENISAVEIGSSAENLVYVIYTSGSTGRPKGTAMPHGSMTNLLDWHQRALPLQTGARVLQFAALSFDVGFQEIFSTLCGGGTLVLLDEWVRKDARALAQLLSGSAIERLFVPPLVLQSLAESYQSDAVGSLPLKDVITAGEQLRVTSEVVEFFGHLPGCRLHNHYGPTETHVVTALTLTGDAHQWPALPSIGRPVSNTQIHILDARGQSAPVGVAGEIFIGGANVARGYLGRPELTRQRFVGGIEQGSRLYRTGDLGRWCYDGSIEYLGRNDDQVKIRGFRIELGEIEVHLAKHAGVKEAAVIAREGVPGQKRLVAYIVPHDGGEPSVEVLRAYMKDVVPDHMVPSAFVMLEKLPLNPNGKLDRRALPAPEMGAYVSRQYEDPKGEIEQTVARIWGGLLRVPRVGRHDNFFELGGHSLLLVQMMERLRRAGLSATVRKIYDSSTLTALAETLSGEKADTFVVPPNRIPAGCDKITPEMLTLVGLESQHIERIAQTVAGGAQNIQDIYPLAPLQEGMLFHYLLSEKRGDTYVLPIQLELSSREKANDLISALQHLIDRHDILRTAVLWEQLPSPLQVVSRQATLPLEELVLDPSRDVAEQLKAHMAPDQQRLDLKQAPLMKLKLANDTARGRSYAILQLHHLACDHESLQIMFSEVLHYLERRPGHPPEPVPYREHVTQALEHARKQDAQAFFRSKLGDIDEPSAPFGLIDVHAGANRFEEVRETLDSPLSHSVRATARRLNVSAATLFHAAWAAVVSRTTGRDDVVFGTVLLGRLQGSAGAQQTLGMFMNTLPLRLHAGAVTVQEFVERTHRELVELFNHEQASLAEAQRCSGITGGTPLFSTVLNYRHSAGDSGIESALVRNGIEITGIESWTNYPIMLSIDDLNDDFLVSVQTDRRLDPRRLIGYVTTALRSIVECLTSAPQTPATSLGVLPTSELRHVIEEFNRTEAAYPQSIHVHQMFEEQVRLTPDSPAAVCGHQSLSYTELNARANQLARHLVERGLRPDQLVGVCLPRGLDMVVALLGTLKAGGAYVALDPDYPAERLRYLLADSAPRFLLAVAGSLPTTEIETIDLEAGWVDISRQPAEDLLPAELGLTAENLAYIIYTSGSTGRPKGVAIEHRNTVNLIHWAKTTFPACMFERTLFSTSLNFDLSIYECFVPLASGGCVHIVKNALALVATPVDVTLINTVPSAIKGVLESGSVPRGTQVINLAGEALKKELVEEIFTQTDVAEVCNLYGPSETTTYSTWVSMPRKSGFNGSIGRPIANTQIYILNRHFNPVPIGVVGEVFIGGDGVARGYLNRPDLTEERFVADPFSSKTNARMYRTGDMGRWLPDGTIEYLGRTDHQIKIRGFRVELGEIESQLLTHPEIKEALVIAREDIPGEKRLAAYVTVRATVDVQAIREHMRSVLPEHMIPGAIVALEALPLTPNGKLDRRALPAPEVGAYASQAFVAPEGEIEAGLADIWKALLSLNQVGRHDNFFELGGHSLNGIKLIAAVAERFGAAISVPQIFSCPTIAQMAAAIGEKLSHQIEGDPESVSLEGDIRAPLSFSQLAHWNLYGLAERPSYREVASVTRLTGPFNFNAFRKSVAANIRRHDALRTRIVVVDGVPEQEIVPSITFEPELIELTAVAENDRAVEIDRQIEGVILRPIDVSVAPVFAIRVLRFSAREHVLILATEHMISDAFSVGVLLRDLLDGYSQIAEGRALSLPTIPLQFHQQSVRQHRQLESMLRKRGDYWNECLRKYRRVRFPAGEVSAAAAEVGWAEVPIEIGAEMRARLTEWCQAHQTTVVMAVFAAYAALTLRWCGSSEMVIQYVTDGRDDPSTRDSMGYFASMLYLPVRLEGASTFVDMVRQVTQRYVEAHANADASYLESRVPRPDFTGSTGFNWIPQTGEVQGRGGLLGCSPVYFKHPRLHNLERDSEPVVVLSDAKDRIVGGTYFPAARFDRESMKLFVRNFYRFVYVLVSDPATYIESITVEA